MNHIAIGELGEKIATHKLIADGRKVLYKNYRGPRGGEIDIVARHDDVLTFVEVKTRCRRSGTRPLDAVNAAKQELLERGARSWLGLLNGDDILWRFDVVEVTLEEGQKPSVNIVENAF